MWVRGLKLPRHFANVYYDYVAPHVGAWIETSRQTVHRESVESHPMWVRGLKLNDDSSSFLGSFEVAPHVGAWIETFVE